MTLLDIDLAGLYKLMFIMQKEYGFNISDIEGMMYFEMMIYVREIENYIREEEKRLKKIK